MAARGAANSLVSWTVAPAMVAPKGPPVASTTKLRFTPWSQTLVFHPHLHCLVTGGGLTDEGQWRAVRHGFLLPARVVMAVFRDKLLAALRRGMTQGQLTLSEGRSRQQLENLLNKLGRPKWNVHIRERYAHGAGVLT